MLFSSGLKIVAATCLLLLLWPALSFAALSNPPVEDIHFRAEHLAEAAQEARYSVLPLPEVGVRSARWTPVVQAGIARADGEFAEASGELFAAGASRAWGNHWGLGLFAFYDRFDVDGGGYQSALTPGNLDGVPLDIPESAEFTAPSGAFRHHGVGVVVTRDHVGAHDTARWGYIGGLLLERLDLSDYRVHYRLLGGADAGAGGEVDHSGSNTLVTVLFGVQGIQHITPRLALTPHVIIGAPLAPGEFTTRMTGPGFDISTAATGGRPGNIGDAFLALGMGLRDRTSGLAIDVGAALGFPAYQRYVHEGIDRSVLVSVSWHGG